MAHSEEHFGSFRQNIIGIDQTFLTPFGEKQIVYADWTASGRLYDEIEDKIVSSFGPFVGNTHSEASITGMSMTHAYQRAHQIIKQHVNAGPNDVIINAGFGMTACVNKFQRILGLKMPEQYKECFKFAKLDRPVVFLSHMEHHSNQTSWLETIADCVIIPPGEDGLVDLEKLEKKVRRYKNRPLKIGAFTACSNVTGIRTPIHDMAKIMHEHDGFCFIDYAASAPYDVINMHPENPLEKLDAVLFSPHKFLGGPGSSGVLIFNSLLYKLKVPDNPGGGTVNWTNPWHGHQYISDIEIREDGGTPGFLQATRAALAIRLKEQMGIKHILQREEELKQRMLDRLLEIPNLHILADTIEDRMGIFSFYVDRLHYNLIVKLLNDRYGIQSRGGCSCAGTYGHYLLHVGPRRSRRITAKIDGGDLSEKPGWVRISIHPTTTNDEADYIVRAVREVVMHGASWADDYTYNIHTNEFLHKSIKDDTREMVEDWLRL